MDARGLTRHPAPRVQRLIQGQHTGLARRVIRRLQQGQSHGSTDHIVVPIGTQRGLVGSSVGTARVLPLGNTRVIPKAVPRTSIDVRVLGGVTSVFSVVHSAPVPGQAQRILIVGLHRHVRMNGTHGVQIIALVPGLARMERDVLARLLQRPHSSSLVMQRERALLPGRVIVLQLLLRIRTNGVV